jgi:hypothetical protein
MTHLTPHYPNAQISEFPVTRELMCLISKWSYKIDIFPAQNSQIPHVDYRELPLHKGLNLTLARYSPHILPQNWWSRVLALPLAAGRNIGGHYKWHFSPFFISSLFRLIVNSAIRGCRRVLKF